MLELLIYQAKPQRGGKSIPVNTNNPPQDPPPPPVVISEKSVEFSVSSVGPEPPTPEPVKVKPIKVVSLKVKPKVTKIVTAKIVKLTFREKIFRFLKKIFRRG